MSATATKETTTQRASQVGQPKPEAREQLPVIRGPRLPYHPLIQERFGIDKASWKALVEAIFPGATSIESVILALSYCKARNLDPFKRNVHIVPIWNSDQRCMVDTIWPGIGELRTTAFRTGDYAGRGATVYGADLKQKVGTAELTFPEWAQVTVYRMVKGQRVEFVGPKVYWLETYAVQKRDDDTPNQMWRDRPRGQIEKCAEASALRAAFPEEVGCDYIPEEVQGQRASAIETTAVKHKDNSLESLTKQLTAKEPGTEPSEVDAVSDVAGESVSEAEEKALLEDASVQDSIDEALKVLAWSPPNKDSKLTAICKQKFSLSRLEDCSVEQKREVLTWLEGQLEQ